jgi:hypothetical protein
MRADLISLAKNVHKAYPSPCKCKLNGEEPWRGVVQCARKILFHQAESLMNSITELGYTNKEIATQTKYDPSTTSRAHGGGAELQLGMSKLFDLVRSLEKALEDSRQERFDRSTGTDANIVQPYDYCPTKAVTQDLRDEAVVAVYSNVRSILLSRPIEERRPLPGGIEGLIASLGDPGYGIVVMQMEPTEEVERLKRQRHEIKHFMDRLDDKIGRLESEKKLREKRKPPRARFS